MTQKILSAEQKMNETLNNMRLTAAPNLLKCQTSKCSSELEEIQKQKKILHKQVLTLAEAFRAKKLTPNQFKAKTEALILKMSNTEATRKLARCSLTFCQSEVVALFNNVVQLLDSMCNDMEKAEACGKFKESVKIMKVKKLTVAGYIKMLKLMVSALSLFKN